MFSEDFDINKFFKEGYFVSQIDKSTADNIFNDIEKEVWVYVKPEADEYSGKIEKDYKNRYVSLRSILNPMNHPRSYQAYQDKFNEWAKALLIEYKTAKRVHLSALMGLKGYFMDMHSDVGDRCPFTVLLYLGKDLDDDPQNGGNLNIFEVNVKRPNENPVLVESIVPSHGKIVVLNNLDPTIYHSVDEIKTNIKRYSILSSFGIDVLPDWNYQYEIDSNMSGQVLNPGRPVCIDDHGEVLKFL